MRTFNFNRKSMKKIKIVIACLACLPVGMADLWAQNIESVELCDGSVLEGYISEQYPGKSITFSACRATIVIPEKAVASIINHQVEYASLSADWKHWIDEYFKEKKEVVLSDIRLANELDDGKVKVDSAVGKKQRTVPEYLRVSPYKVRILEKGAMIKYLDLNPQTFHLKWTDVKYIRRPHRSKLVLSGLNSVIRLKGRDGEYVGEIVEQVLGKQIRLLKEDGMIEVINSDQMVSIRGEKLNPDQDIFEQAVLLDQVYTRTNGCMAGLIVGQNFINTKERPAFLTVLNKNGESHIVPYSDVEKYGRCLNPDYKLLTDIVLNDTTVMINRQEVRHTSFEQNKESFLYAKDLDCVVTLKRDSLEDRQFVILEVKDKVGADKYALICAVEKHEKEKKKESVRIIGFTYEDFAIYSTRAVEQTVSVNGTCKMKFSVTDPGWYVLYLPKQKKGILCHIE